MEEIMENADAWYLAEWKVIGIEDVETILWNATNKRKIKREKVYSNKRKGM